MTCSILPHTPYATALAERCHAAGKEVMLHLPMQPRRDIHRPGPGSLAQGQARRQITRRVRAGFADVPSSKVVMVDSLWFSSPKSSTLR